ncbi:MAG: DNA repair protein RecN [Dictyoglomaceae bacterium]|nr:DNA repair protein RecN [Dictyoglomaceae bacterium]
MLLALHVKDFAIIDEITLDFQEGLNVITGETGAGKSLLIDALSFLLGERVSTEIIRTGSNKAIVEALFSVNPFIESILDEWGIPKEEDNTLLVYREINKTGRSKCRVNGELVTVGMLEKLLSNIMEIHGQYEHQKILHRDAQLELMDFFGGEECLKQKRIVKEMFESLRKLYSERDNIYEKEKERQQRIDLLKFQIEEIDRAKLVKGEEETLIEERKFLQNLEKIKNSLEEAYILLYESQDPQISALDQISKSLNLISSLSSLDKNIENIYELLSNSKLYLEEAIDSLIRFKDGLNIESSKLEEVEERLYRISQLKRKYGRTIEEILEYRKKIEEELRELLSSEERLEEIEKEIQILEEQIIYEAKKLSEIRREISKTFEENIERELKDLGMENAKFSVRFLEPIGSHVLLIKDMKISSKGLEDIEFLLSTNPGEDLKTLKNIASGGEISRIMLSLRTIINKIDQTPILIFDEIDTGIGGETSYLLAQKLWNLSLGKQVFCVTHLPQIAAWADAHFYVEKKMINEQTRVKVSMLEEKSRIIELSRMFGGSIVSEVSQQHAKEMLLKANELKKSLKDKVISESISANRGESL